VLRAVVAISIAFFARHWPPEAPGERSSPAPGRVSSQSDPRLLKVAVLFRLQPDLGHVPNVRPEKVAGLDLH